MNVSQKLAVLENENNARKASYPVAGSLVRFVSQVSPVYTRTGGENVNLNVRVRFTFGATTENGKAMVTLFPKVSVDSEFVSSYPRVSYVNEPQLGDGSVVLNLQIATSFIATSFFIRVVAFGVCEGTFEIL